MSHVRRALVIALIAVGGASSCSGGDDEAEREPEISELSVERPRIELEVTRSEYISPHRTRGPIPEPEAEAALATVQRLFQATVVDAAVLGRPGDATRLFTPDALAQVRGGDYRAFVDAEVGPLPGLEADRARVGLAGLADDDDRPQLIVAAIDWDVQSPDGTVRIRRVGELSLVPQGGSWRVAAYSLLSERTVDGKTTSTTAEGGPR